MKYCRRCVIPDTRPNITLDAEGICNACRSHESRAQIDWAARERKFRDVAAHAKSRSKGYDCVIPVSGGKDSTWQTVTCLEYGLKPLAVSWKPPARTEIGAQNLRNLVRLGVDHIDYSINPEVERKFMLASLERFGTTAIPMHMAIFNIPLRIAVNFEIPLIVWGENSAFEYGGTDEESRGFELDARWMKKFGVTHGTRAQDWVSSELSKKDLAAYFAPDEKELKAKGTLAVFLGYYFPWDVETSLQVAKKHGFQASGQGPKTGLYDYADIDDEFISIHHHLKWYKFGFTRLFDNLSLEIRNGRMTRAQALDRLRAAGDQTPREDIAKFCRFARIQDKAFFDTIEKFRNPEIWARENGCYKIKNFLIPDWRWS